MATSIMCAGQGGNDTVQIGPAPSGNNGGNGFTGYSPLGGSISIQAMEAATEYLTQAGNSLAVDSAFTASGMTARITGTGGSGTLTANITNCFNINGSPGQCAIVMTPATPTSPIGVPISDNGMQDIFHAGDVASFQIGYPGGAAGGVAYTSVQWNANQPGGSSVPLSACAVSTGAAPGINTHATRWLPAAGSWPTTMESTIPGRIGIQAPCAGNWSGLKTVVTGNSGGTAGRHRYLQSVISNSYITAGPLPGTIGVPGSGNYGNQIVTIADNLAVSAPVPLADPGNRDLVAMGQYILVELNSPDSASDVMFFGGLSSTFTSSDPNTTPLMCGGPPYQGATTSKQWNEVFAGQPRLAANTSENMALCPSAGTMSGLSVSCNSVSGTPSAQFYINGTLDPAGQSYGSQAIAALAAQVPQQDTGNRDIIQAGAAFANTFTGFGTGNFLTAQSVAFTAPGAGGAHPSNMLLLDAG